MGSPHFVSTVIAPRKPESAELVECVLLRSAGFGRHCFWGDDIDCGLLRKVFPTRFPRPLEELRGAERACRDLQSVRFHHTDNPGLRLIAQCRSRSRSIILNRSSFVEGLAGLLPFGRCGGSICGFHATEVLLSKLGKLLVAEVEHGGLLQEKIAMCLEVIDLPFQPFTLLG